MVTKIQQTAEKVFIVADLDLDFSLSHTHIECQWVTVRSGLSDYSPAVAVLLFRLE